MRIPILKKARYVAERGFTLLEMILTLVVLAILVMGTIPLAQNAIQRQKELKLRENLRLIRNAIDEFRRDTVGACGQGAVTTANPTAPGAANVPADPRSRVVIDDCSIFDTMNLDRYPPTLEILTEGVKIRPRGISVAQGGGGVFGDRNASDNPSSSETKKIYLREIPIDPMTGESTTWIFRSSYQSKDDDSWDEINVFDVRSGSDGTALNGEKYRDW